ncbi:porin-like protein [Rhizobium sp. PP-F2F-G48]|uniref:porin n=1 Tax=Rhizobium sp. PP-F2F-G48 TaxID=2135651 RepID=UPI00104C1259|nr:porin [Rhizobium sp. PP-F2F-G48]TCM57805.1 porin-like protein [Rhizobium sp. PP-F2F-G48]
MNIKSLLLGSAAALAAVSGAHAADAIVAAEPEAMEYVRVCDAFGTGYFYIPGTETCLKIGGYVRTQLEYNDDSYGIRDNGDVNAYSRGYLTIEAKNDTEFGALSSYINIQADADGETFLDGAWINIAGFDVGYFYSWWDDGLSGETDSLDSSFGALQNSARYTYDGGSFLAGVSVDEIEGGSYPTNNDPNDSLGVSGKLGATIAGFNIYGLAAYDFDAEEAAFRILATAELGPGTLGIAGSYATDPNYYYDRSEWTVAAEYAIKATEKFTITPAAQYFGNVRVGSEFSSEDAWRVGVTAGYQITTGLRTLATVNYTDSDDGLPGDQKDWTGFLRLQRDF